MARIEIEMRNALERKNIHIDYISLIVRNELREQMIASIIENIMITLASLNDCNVSALDHDYDFHNLLLLRDARGLNSNFGRTCNARIRNYFQFDSDISEQSVASFSGSKCSEDRFAQ